MTATAREPLRLAMVGGGQGAFIGAVHRMAARLDGEYRLVAGALSSRPEIARASGAELGLEPGRSYPDFDTMIAAEAARPDGAQVVAVVTPNHMHLAPAAAALRAGLHVICDKPLAADPDLALDFARGVAADGPKFLLTHNYTGYPLMRQARQMARSGELGEIRVVQAEYAQDWLAADVSNKQADWRTDPARSGAGGAIGDIGTHAHNLLRFVTGLEVEALAADLRACVPGRRVDDNANLMLRFAGGATGMLWASQVAVGQENGLRLRVYGTRGGIEWCQIDPNRMWVAELGQPGRWMTRGGPGVTAAGAAGRVPPGHPEGYLEAFATLYRDFADVVRTGRDNPLLPGLADGVEGMLFIKAALASSAADGAWTRLR
ncbi:MAG: Gfo/Idh/MocA family protein [Tranquillimonas sp.]